MTILFRYICVVLICSLLSGASLGFGTGSHFDLTRMVLREHNFQETSIKIVQVENWLTDYYANSPTYGRAERAVLENLHFDNLFNNEQVKTYWRILLRNLRSATEKAATENDRLSMLVVLGIGLHAVQDFYSHSNWAELHPPSSSNEFRADTFFSKLSSLPMDPVVGLHTGKFPDNRLSGPGPSLVPVNADAHGGYHNGLNKDSPMRPRWDEAFVFAYAGSHELVDAMATWAESTRPGFWRSVMGYAVDATTEQKLNFDVSASRNISMWLEGKGQDGTWKGEGSGSSRFFAKFSSNWITEDSSVFVRAIRDGRIQDEIAADLYSGETAPEMVSIKPFSLKRNALVIKVLYIAESKDKNFLRRRITSSLGGSDFYSRITAGGQEFWGRTIQKSRASIDPWYELFLFGTNTTKIPIVISVWDEDHTDPAKDAHVDINPAAGRSDLELIYNVADGRLFGDISGIFNSLDRPFFSEGKEPANRRALIRGVITQRQVR